VFEVHEMFQGCSGGQFLHGIRSAELLSGGIILLQRCQ
jgi:hypothetical protein